MHLRGHLNIEMLFYQYGDSYYKDKMVSWLSYLCNGIPIPEKMVFMLKQGPVNPTEKWYANPSKVLA